MKITNVPFGPHPILGMHPFVIGQKSQLKNLTERRQAKVAALQNLQRDSTKGRAPAALAAQLRAQQQLVASLDVAAAVIVGGMPRRIPA